MKVEKAIKAAEAAPATLCAEDEFARWRGRCLNLFATMEQDVSRLLARVLASDQSKETASMLLGDRLRHLREWCEAQGSTHAKLVKAIDCYREVIPLRNHLSHAVATMKKSSADWQVELRMICTVKGGGTMSTLPIGKAQLEPIHRKLKSEAQSLGKLIENAMTLLPAVEAHIVPKPWVSVL